jgi:NTE family protein
VEVWFSFPLLVSTAMNSQLESINASRGGGNKQRYRVGLALSSGGAKGLAHIGVIQVLEENGIEVDVVAGCSMGAYVAAVWCCGYDGDFMETLAREVEGRWGLLKLLDPVVAPRKGFILGNAMKNRLKKSIGDAHFSDLSRPLRIVATNLDTLEREVFSSGEVASAVHASSAMPGVCVPVTIDEQAYIDGGVSDPLPVDVLKEMGCERIIAVNTIPTPDFLRSCREMEHEQTEFIRRRHGLLPLLNRRLNYFARGNILDIIMRAFHGAQIRVAEEACRQADIVLRPLTNDAHWHDFNHPAKYIALGRATAEAQLDEIKSLLKEDNTSHEPHFAQGEMVAFA